MFHTTLAVKYSFSVKQIHAGVIREWYEDSLLLAIAGTTGSGNTSNTWPMGLISTNQTIDNRTDLVVEFDVSECASNLSVAFGLLDAPDQNDTAAIGMSSPVPPNHMLGS